jgi:hypothetical protein
MTGKERRPVATTQEFGLRMRSVARGIGVEYGAYQHESWAACAYRHWARKSAEYDSTGGKKAAPRALS